MEGDAKFSWRKAVRFGWESMKDNIIFWIIVVLLWMILTGGFSSLGRTSVDGFYPFAPFGLLSTILGLFFSIAFARLGLKLVDGERPEFTDLWDSYRVFWKFLGGWILYGLIVIGGLILLIVPGIIWAIKYSQWELLVVEQGMGPMEALRKSARLTDDAKWDLFLAGLVFLGIIILGAIACGVGLLAAFPVVFVARAHIYRQLVAATPAAEVRAGNIPPTEPPAAG